MCAPARESRAGVSDGATPIAAPAEAHPGRSRSAGNAVGSIRAALDEGMTAAEAIAADPPKSVPPPGKHQHHDPVFPSAFVFQSNSALFLAIDWTPAPRKMERFGS